MSTPDANAAAESGVVTLVDIRRPDEWALTGVGDDAAPITMLERGFIVQISAQVGDYYPKPIALICARRVRSRKIASIATIAPVGLPSSQKFNASTQSCLRAFPPCSRNIIVADFAASWATVSSSLRPLKSCKGSVWRIALQSLGLLPEVHPSELVSFAVGQEPLHDAVPII